MRIAILAIILSLLFAPSKIKGVKYFAIQNAQVVKAFKNSPPFIAFEVINQIHEENETIQLSQQQFVSTIQIKDYNQIVRPIFSQKMALAEDVIKKVKTELRTLASENELTDYDFSGLNNAQKIRLEIAQREKRILEQNWNPDPYSDEIANVADLIANSINRNKYNPKFKITDEHGRDLQIPTSEIKENYKEESYHQVSTANGRTKITGPLEFSGGLAITNDHHIEIRRFNEGIAKEIGQVDLMKGTYSIDVSELSGLVVGRLVDNSGKSLGQSSFRLSHLNNLNMKQTGPKLEIQPEKINSGKVISVYSTQAKNIVPSNLTGKVFNGDDDIRFNNDGSFEIGLLSKNSSTIFTAIAPGYLPTKAAYFSDQNANFTLFSEKLIDSLFSLLSSTVSGPLLREDHSVIWGKATLDGKTISGVTVEIESDSSAKVVYLNEIYLPDPRLSSTSSNGAFVIITKEEGFVSILGKRGEKYFSYINTIVANNSVSPVNLESTIKTELSNIRVFDAFNSRPLAAELSIQSNEEVVDVLSGTEIISLPSLNRWGYVKAVPHSEDFVQALYEYNDSSSFIHIPLISYEWLERLKRSALLDDSFDSGIITGFVPQFDFEIYVAGDSNKGESRVVFFDESGMLKKSDYGMAGGGFVIFNVPSGTHEVIVINKSTGKIFSKITYIDGRSAAVLTYRDL